MLQSLVIPLDEGAMDSALLIIFYSLGSFLFFISASLVSPIFRLPGYRRPAVFLITAYIFLGAVFIASLIRLVITSEDFILTIPGLLLFVGSGVFFVTGTHLLEKRIRTKEQEQCQEKAVLEEIRDMNRIFQQSLNGLSIPVAIKDKQGVYLFCNPAFADLVNQTVDHLIGKTDEFYLSTEEAASNRRLEEKVLASGQPYVEEKKKKLDGVSSTLQITRSILRNIAGDEPGVLIIAKDISEESDLEMMCSRWQKAANSLADAESSLARSPILNLENSPYIDRVLNLYASLAGTPNVGIWQVVGDPVSAHFVQGLGKTGMMKGTRLRPGEDVAGKVLQTGKIMLIPDFYTFQGTIHWPREIRIGAAVGLPLRNKDQLVNIVTVFWEQPAPNLPPEIAQILEILSSSISADLANSAHLNTLAIEISDWQKKTAALQYRVRLEHIIAMIAAHFISLSAEKVDEVIVHSLQTISKLAAIDRSYLVLFARGEIPELTHPVRYSGQQNGRVTAFGPVPNEEDKWYPLRINQGEVVAISRTYVTQEEEDSDISTLRQKGLKSFYAVPLMSNRSVIGYLGFEALRGEVDWPADIISLLKVAADMFVNLLDRKWSARLQQEKQEKLSQQIRELENNNQENIYIAQMGDLLQACRTSDEAYPIITRYLQKLIPNTSGALYMIQDVKDPAEKVAEWGQTSKYAMEQELVQNECWSLRRGRVYMVEDPSVEPVCGHIKESIHTGYICVPLLAHGVAAGILHLRSNKKIDRQPSFNEAQLQLASRIAEYIAMPLTNLRLRDELRSQAIRDPLTKLFNRRYMEETLEREIRRATRHQTSVGIIMFDVDKMKPINDQFGHDAGDLLLKTLGRELLGMFRGEDVACRYGGDEFTIVLPEAGLAEVWRRAEQMRETIKRLSLVYDGKPLGQISLSIGVAAFPDHGQNTERVLLAADAASYNSKTEGGDRIMMGRKIDN